MCRGMMRVVVLLAGGVAAAAAGCAHSSPGGALSEAPTPGPMTQRLVAEAAARRYPEDVPPSDELKVTAVVDRQKHTIALRNFGDEALKDLDVWVNGEYVRRVPALPARGGLVINFSQFYDARGLNLGTQHVTVSKVQLSAGNKLYNVMGPAYD